MQRRYIAEGIMKLSLFLIFAFITCISYSQTNLDRYKLTIQNYALLDSLKNYKEWYNNSNLGISFPYDKLNNNTVEDFIEPNLLKDKWKTFLSPYFKISFSYPSKLVIREIKRLDNYLDLDSDSTIQLGYYADVEKDNSFLEFVPIVEIFGSKRTFDEIAEYEGFEKKVPDAEISKIIKIFFLKYNWKLKGKYGLNGETYYLEGKEWKGLYGYNFKALKQKDETYFKLIPFRKIFLRKNSYKLIYLIISFYDGPNNDFVEDKQDKINMKDFLKIVSSIKIIGK